MTDDQLPEHPGVPREITKLVKDVRSNPNVQSRLEAAAEALVDAWPVPGLDLVNVVAMQAFFACIDQAVDVALKEIRTPASDFKLRGLLAHGVWRRVYPDKDPPFRVTPRVELWAGMRSVIGIDDGRIVSSIDPNELPRVKRVMDGMAAGLQRRKKRGRPTVYKSDSTFLADLRRAVGSLRQHGKVNQDGSVSKEEVIMLLPKKLSITTLERTAETFGIDLEAELGEIG